MIKIRAPKAFDALIECDSVNGDFWETVTKEFSDSLGLLRLDFPRFVGTLDHVEVREDAVIFHDTGVFKDGKFIQNSFKITK